MKYRVEASSPCSKTSCFVLAQAMVLIASVLVSNAVCAQSRYDTIPAITATYVGGSGVDQILGLARAQSIATSEAADRLARERFESAKLKATEAA